MGGGRSVTEPLLAEKEGGYDNGDTEKALSSFSLDHQEPITFMVLLTTFTALCGPITYGTASGYTSPTQMELMSDLKLSITQFSFFGSALTIGGIIGAACCGTVADLMGRRGALWFSNTFCVGGWISIVLSQGYLALVLGRLSLGLGVGIICYVVPVYIVETAPASIRGVLTALTVFTMAGGVAISYLVGAITSWRKLALIGLIPCMVEYLCLLFVPESPRWLARVGRLKEAEAALQRLRGKGTDISKESAEIKSYMDTINKQTEGGFNELFQRKYARAVIIAVGLLMVQQLGGLSGYCFYMNLIFLKAGFPSAKGTVITTSVQFVTNILGIFIVDKFGRRPLMMFAAAVMCFASLLTGSSFLLKSYGLLNEATPVLTLIGVLVFFTSLSIGIGGIPWVLISEITPINIKGPAGTLANLVSWSSNWVVAYTFNLLFRWSSSGVFFIYAIVAAFGVIFVCKLVPETKDRPLEEIQESITR